MFGQILVTVGASVGALVIVLIVAGQLARRRLAARIRPSGRLVEIDGRRVHVDVRGNGGPTVVLEGGTWTPAIFWRGIADDLAADATVVTYDRAGLGHSDPSPNPRTADVMADELRATLAVAGASGPYLLVGHSTGGTIVRSFAHRHPEAVAGLVLVDASHEEQFERAPESLRAFQRRMTSTMRPMFGLIGLAARAGLLAVRPSLVPAAAGVPGPIADEWRVTVAARPSVVATMAREMLDLDASNAAVRAAGIDSLGDIPLVVLSHGRAEGTPPQLGPEVADAYEALWQELQVRQAALSPRGRRIVVDGAGHDIPTERPDVVLAAIREVLSEAAMAVSERPMAAAGVVAAAPAADAPVTETAATTRKERQDHMQTIGKTGRTIGRIGRTIGTLAIAAVLAACVGTAGGAAPTTGAPSVDAGRAAEIADVAFPALNSGDYAAWSAAWSDALKGAIDARAFEGFRQNVQSQLGAYVSHGEPVYGSKSSGTFRWTFEVTFEKGTASFAFGFVDGQTTIDGVFVE